jgi:MFS family permease
MITASYYLPLWFQATKGISATKSGLDILPFMLSNVIAAGLAGFVVSKTGRYWHLVFVSPLLSAVGAGLLYTVSTQTPFAAIAGFQILLGAGIGGSFQNTIMAIQTEYSDEPARVPQATSLVNFTQLMGGVIGLAAAGTLFSNKLRDGLPVNLSPEARITVTSSVEAIKLLSPALREGVIEAYVQALRPVFLLGVPIAALASVSAL